MKLIRTHFANNGLWNYDKKLSKSNYEDGKEHIKLTRDILND